MSIEATQCAPISATEDETWAAVEVIVKAVASDSPLCKALQTIRYNGYYISKMIRGIKIGTHFQASGKSHSTVPEILISGKWLQQKGFNPGNKIWVLPFSEMLIVIPQGPK
ncbi:SymE family type I addiction module toxin [Niastella sp. OAS944]|uniref:SymE family type I addiction module toxin n=1 Tax=Niastella sp. OAS944 TaxID=2664089 RepID=UPI003470F703|nr:hypothetical protein [Chitinophagaceae bacterium OAS944]